MDYIVDKHYNGFEGEPEIKFIHLYSDSNKKVLRIWEGYFDCIMSAIKPTSTGWLGLSYYYNLHQGWYEECPWKIPDVSLAIDEFSKIDKNILSPKTKDVLSDIFELLLDAQCKNDTVLISYD